MPQTVEDNHENIVNNMPIQLTQELAAKYLIETEHGCFLLDNADGTGCTLLNNAGGILS